MTYRDEIPSPPPCPVCETTGDPNRALPALGRWVCHACTPIVFYDGTQTEWEQRAPARERRKAAK